MESNEKLRIKITQQELTIDHLQKELTELKDKLGGAEAHGPAMSGSIDNKVWKSAIVTRMYEGKLKALEADLEKKVNNVYDCQILLQLSNLANVTRVVSNLANVT